ncbi:MAG: transposase [Cyanobacteria bacterium P01_A01_bin.83]
MSWVSEELKDVDLGDKRRNERLVKIVEDLSSQPEQSVPEASRDGAAVQGVYKFWGNPRIKASAILAAHTDAALKRIKHDITQMWLLLRGEEYEILARAKFSAIEGEEYKVMFSGQGKKRGEKPVFAMVR